MEIAVPGPTEGSSEITPAAQGRCLDPQLCNIAGKLICLYGEACPIGRQQREQPALPLSELHHDSTYSAGEVGVTFDYQEYLAALAFVRAQAARPEQAA